ncbi:MAG: hypothetical protein KAS32_16815 [Candidatus Peribacteraceae bacterium]|nr:hypothetical protein [Candidatus Peribacteraceae bacterium]
MWPFDIFSTKMKYTNKEEIVYQTRYDGKVITVPEGYETDGATGAPDICEKAWTVHDWICEYGVFDDDTTITNKQASTIYCDILKEEGKWLRCYDRWVATYLFGGNKLKGSIAGYIKGVFK